MKRTACKPRKLIWIRGYDWINRIEKAGGYDYGIKGKRIAAMAFAAGWKAGKRDSAVSKRKTK